MATRDHRGATLNWYSSRAKASQPRRNELRVAYINAANGDPLFRSTLDRLREQNVNPSAPRRLIAVAAFELRDLIGFDAEESQFKIRAGAGVQRMAAD